MNATTVQIMGAAWGTSVFVNQALMALTASQKLHNLVPVLLQDPRADCLDVGTTPVCICPAGTIGDGQVCVAISLPT